jgi:hypothetical protein
MQCCPVPLPRGSVPRSCTIVGAAAVVGADAVVVDAVLPGAMISIVCSAAGVMTS